MKIEFLCDTTSFYIFPTIALERDNIKVYCVFITWLDFSINIWLGKSYGC